MYKALKTHFDERPDEPWLKPSQLLVEVVESGATLKEEMYFRKVNRVYK